MAVRGQVTIVEWECDSCGKVRRAASGTEPKGFHGEVTEVKEQERQVENDEFKTWYACSVRCIGPAVKKIMGYESTGAPSEDASVGEGDSEGSEFDRDPVGDGF